MKTPEVMRLVFIFAADLMLAALVIASKQTGTSVELEIRTPVQRDIQATLFGRSRLRAHIGNGWEVMKDHGGRAESHGIRSRDFRQKNCRLKNFRTLERIGN